MRLLHLFIAATAALVICGNAFSKPDDAPPVVDVVVQNDEENPVSVTIGEPFQHHFIETCPTNGFGCGPFACYVVPSDKRLVIEYVSVIVGDVDAGDAVGPRVGTTVGGQGMEHELGVTSESTGVGGFKNIVWGKKVKFYADPDTTVYCSFRRELGSSTYGYGMSFALSGYLETAE